MRTAIFDLETSSPYADTGILLCAVIKEYRSKDKPTVIRADAFPEWKTNRANCKPVVIPPDPHHEKNASVWLATGERVLFGDMQNNKPFPVYPFSILIRIPGLEN